MSCTAKDPFVPPPVSELQIALLLTDSASQASSDAPVYALLAAVGSPLEAPLVRAERFEMTRVVDGAAFDWQWLATPHQVLSVESAAPEHRNYVLPFAGTGGRLGARDLRAGERYRLHIEAGADTLDGEVRIPDPIRFVPDPGGADSVAHWRRVGGAGAFLDYFVSRGEPVYAVLGQDTTRIVSPVYLPRQWLNPDGTFDLTVTAIDSNYTVFLGDRRVTAAGIRGGRGVFGAFTRGIVRLGPFAPRNQ
jgi:hypothetical protein